MSETSQESLSQLLHESGFALLDQDSNIEDVRDALRQLATEVARFSPVDKALIREEAAKHLRRIGFSAPMKAIDAALGQAGGPPERSSSTDPGLKDPEPWPEPVEGIELLNELRSLFERFLILPAHASEMLALWVVHTYVYFHFLFTPYLAISSATMRCGKTTLLDILQSLCSRALMGNSLTPGVAYRIVDRCKPTLEIDEFEEVPPDLRSILNAGYRKGGAVPRCVGEDHEPQFFETFCPKAFAAIRKPPGTILDRSISLTMRRKKRNETVERFRPGDLVETFEISRRKIFRWTQDHGDEIGEIEPDLVSELNDRQNDNWLPLFAIAEVAGADWPEKARQAALSLSGEAEEVDHSTTVQLLEDILAILNGRSVDRIHSRELCLRLEKREDRPWPEFRNGRPITPRQLAKLLKPFEISPKQVYIDGKNRQGYEREDFLDAWERYFPDREVLGALESTDIADYNPFENPLGTGPPRGFSNGKDADSERVLGDLGDDTGAIRETRI